SARGEAKPVTERAPLSPEHPGNFPSPATQSCLQGHRAGFAKAQHTRYLNRHLACGWWRRSACRWRGQTCPSPWQNTASKSQTSCSGIKLPAEKARGPPSVPTSSPRTPSQSSASRPGSPPCRTPAGPPPPPPP
ncbi:hypothetical protein ANANG_G00207460, partial [Anguilla anguilla]